MKCLAASGKTRLLMRFLLGGLAVSLCLHPLSTFACETLESCLAQYSEVAVGSSGIDKPESDLAVKVQSYGRDAIPPLLKLLDDKNPAVRQLAGFTLRDMEGLGSEHLPALIKARNNGDSWIPPAIARIGTREAIEFLVTELRKDPRNNTQVTYAFELLGDKGAVYIANLYACTNDCNERIYRVATFMMGKLGNKAVTAIPRLLEIAKDESVALGGRQQAVIGVGQIGVSAQSYAKEVIALREQEPRLLQQVNKSLMLMGSPEAVPALLSLLPVATASTLRDIKTLGTGGNSAGPGVIGYLDNPEWDIRESAADTLGSIGYKPGASALMHALTNEDDWKLVYTAALALGRMDSTESIDALKVVRDTYWYPPVRAVADTSIRHVLSGEPLAKDDPRQYGPPANAPDSCRATKQPLVKSKNTLYSPADKEKLQTLRYETEIRSMGVRENTAPNKSGIIEFTKDNMVERVEKVSQVPTVALKVADGWLTGANRGEWGGELAYISNDGSSTIIYKGNVSDIALIGEQIVVTSGLAHLASNVGFLLRVDKNAQNQYKTTLWKRLPAAPFSSQLTESGELLINTKSGGSVIVNEKGALRMAECSALQ